MPDSHRRHLEWTPGRLLNWALAIGPATRDVVKWQLENRPHPEQGVPLGGPSVAIDPRGDAIVETTDRMALVTLEASAVQAARKSYPGYLAIRARVYADAWDEIARGDG